MGSRDAPSRRPAPEAASASFATAAFMPGLEHFGGRGQARIFAVMLEIRAVAPDRGRDRLARLRMRTNLARQRQQALSHFRIDVRDRHVLRNRCALAFALQIRAEAAGLELNAVAEVLRAFARLPFRTALAELLRVAALGIVGAGDESTELAATQRQPAVAARRADARIAAVLARRNSQGARNSSSASVTSEGFCSMTSSALGLKSCQNSSSTFCQLRRPPETSSSSSSSSAVKS